jgi:Domain of unknown function (DUF5666)
MNEILLPLRLLRRLAAGLSITVIAACGGGVGSGGTGAVAGGVEGTVTGFGSVVVDGVPIDDSATAAMVESRPGVLELADVKLGQRVTVQLERADVAKALRVDPTLIGAVSALRTGGFTVLGQTVLANVDAAAGPVTQFGGGYASLASVAAGDVVEVHGLIVPQGAGHAVQATRIDKRSALPAYLGVSGPVSQLGSDGANRFAIGALQVDASGPGVVVGGLLADGRQVAVLAAAGALRVEAGVPNLVAAQARLRGLDAIGEPATTSGRVAALDPGARRFKVGSITVDYANARLTPPVLDIAEGQYVRVRGAVSGLDRIEAEHVVLRSGGNGAAAAELKGNIVGFDAATSTFTVRDVAVDASAAALTGCPAGGLAEGLYVEVAGALGPTGVRASAVTCSAEPGGANVSREGTAGAVGQAQFELGTASGTVVVHWTARTLFRDVTPETLDGATVTVDGRFVDGVLEARKITKAGSAGPPAKTPATR